MGIGVLYPGVKPSERKVNQSSTSSAEVKNDWSYTSTPAICYRNVNKEKFVLKKWSGKLLAGFILLKKMVGSRLANRVVSLQVPLQIRNC
jgi:hypothetical protein